MSNVNPSEEILKAVTALLQRESKVFIASQVAQRLASVEVDPRFQYDPVARNIAAQIQKVADKDPNQLITAQQINELYKGLESLNPATEFSSAHPDLFPQSALPVAATPELPKSIDLARHNYVDMDQIPGEESIVVDEFTDPSQASYEKPEFGIAASFSNDQYRYAEAGTKQELASFGANNVRLAHKTDAPNLMVYTATFVTPSGKHAVLIPIQVADQPINLPQVFATLDGNRTYAFNQEGFKAFEADNIALMSVKALHAADVLRTDVVANDDNARSPSPLESYINDEQGSASKVAGLEDVESILLNAVSRKQSKYASRTIDAATELVNRELRSAGQHKGAVFAGDAANGDLLYKSVFTLNNRTAEVVVPVEVRSGQVLFPTVFASAAGQTFPLSQAGVEKFFSENLESAQLLIQTKDLVNANFRTLRQTVYAACVDKQYDRATEALTVIAQKFGKEALAQVTADYQQWLATPNLTASTHTFGTSNKMSADDWANAIQAELTTVTAGKETTSTGMDFNFECHSNEHFEGAIMTNRVGPIELT